MRPVRVLSIAGTDPTGGAGIQADLKSIAAQGGYGMAVVTALVAQNTRGVREVHVPPVAFLAAQLDAVSDDVAIDAVKIGMLGDAAVIETVTAWLERVAPPLVVLDPVMIATSGDRLLAPEAEAALRGLLARADLITPNIPELAILAEEPEARSWDTVLEQARRVSGRYGVRVLAKGGHLVGSAAPDALVDAAATLPGGRSWVEFPGERINTPHTHGTGCSLSAALATRIAADGDWIAAVTEVKRWLTESIRHADTLAVGEGHGPISHFAGLWQRGGIDTDRTAAEHLDDWWRRIAPIRHAADDLAFVRQLGDGSLDRDAFSWYLAQDALYLRDYARVLAAAAQLAPTPEEQAFWAQGAYGSIAAELQLHQGWLPEDEVFQTAPAPATTAYVDHLLAAAARGEYEIIIAAVLPCYWLYQDIGTRLHAHSHPDHPYAGWLDTYADETFARSTERAIEYVGEAVRRATPQTRARMFDAFERAAAHEVAFFAAPLAAGPGSSRVEPQAVPLAEPLAGTETSPGHAE
ncbi:bifunctional hydroxymethylpyrimidine kinase/phosphomethylpyrimidine kinase [Mycetocola tolaasinivorans]|uniref:Bifunctional hydroxymethylpyrimidine kinase/phosphomethylpyrimidine kinase n=1 Tax=Mycetocola tolaasinivorans TaxID=76635 RepID=A0A3L7A1I7_9MICO|nr:bifunctional hydroxymethylpyrimidine kinase/phosphomethylpyrimidine kinase [Mycetocola tolaasinivorans]